MGEGSKININKAAQMAKAAEIIARDKAEAEAELAAERKVESVWIDISNRLGRHKEQIKSRLEKNILSGEMTIPGERVWNTDDRGRIRADIYYNAAYEGEEGDVIRKVLLDKFTTWFNREIADGISVTIDNHTNIILKWQIPDSAR